MPAHAVSAPKGYLTIAEAAERSGVSPATVRRAIAAGTVRHLREGWAIFVDRRDVREIELKTRGQEGADRVAVMVRPERARYEAWERAAGDRPVSTWLGELADVAAKRGR
jgi:excisionase family DNA binding protein